MITLDQFIKEHREAHNTKDAVYSAYHYDAMEAYAKQRVIEEMELIPHLETPLGEEIRLSYYYVLKRIKELKNKSWKVSKT